MGHGVNLVPRPTPFAGPRAAIDARGLRPPPRPTGQSTSYPGSPGDTSVTRNTCWEIRTSDVDSLVMLLGEFSDPDAPRDMMSLTE